MAALLRLLVLVCALFAPASAFVAPSMPLCRSAVAPAAAVTMGCRQNLKKEKRVRNRINAFRFKKNSARRRCHRPLARAAHAARRSWRGRAPAAPPSAAPNFPSARPKFPLGARRPPPASLTPRTPSSRAAGGRFQRFNQGNPKQKENEAADSEFVTAVFTYTAQAAAAAEAAEKTEEKAAPAAA